MPAETDYLVVGAGASGLAFADTLVAEADVEVTLVDRRDAPGGHWRQVYPFVRLHTPSAFYGVNSLNLGHDLVDESGENAGYYERATGAEVRHHFEQAMERLVQTGRVRFLPRHEHLGSGPDGEQVHDLATGRIHSLRVRRKVVDARYLEASIPATHVLPFEVAPSATAVPPNVLPEVARPNTSFAVLGGGKTAVDACMWLLDNGVDADRIRWVRPREAWFYDRRHFQPHDLVAATMEGLALDAEAGAAATTIDDLFDRLEQSGRLVRIDTSRRPTMYRGTMLSAHELRAARQVEDVVKLGHVRRIEPDRIVLEAGEVETTPDVVHVDCTALGLRNAPAVPIFEPGRIVLQQVRQLSPCFNAALVAFVEAHRGADEERNRLCPPNAYPSTLADFPRMVTCTWQAEARWLRESDVSAWVGSSRLNLLRDLPQHASEPAARSAVERFVGNVREATQRMGGLSGSKEA